MNPVRTVYLMRHAHASASHLLSDRNRPLDQLGHDQAARIGAQLTGAGIEWVLVSSAARTRQTVADLRLGVEVEPLDALYDGGTGTYLDYLHEVDEALGTVLLVGHNPSIAGLVYRLADPATSDPTALALVTSQFPTATCCQLDFTGSWDSLRQARLVRTLRPSYPSS
ncbi:MAG: histidine phosphatase family protein [Propionibacteriaceae bacterium]|jgi:phosphohistidine phosphatase|nr:histidine phosphatase family protein [Propionibacteriaceae bacterium]